jgi:uncharacterized protein (TIGR03435 family)
MVRCRLLIGVLFCSAVAAFGQELRFDVASVRQSATQSSTGLILVRPGQTDEPGHIRWSGVSMKALVMFAYHVDRDQVGGPQWIEDERYDVIATFPASASREDQRAMVKNLLFERFGVAVREETRTRLQYVLVVGKGGPKLHPAAEKPVWAAGQDHIQSMNTTVGAFAGLLAGWLGRPVVDETGIQGRYDITLRVAVELDGENSLDAQLFSAVEELGLRVEARKMPAPFIVVEKGRRVPTDN